ncbi:hypothetical protein A2952_02750 [Candidatus Kaiserbacteria bacterium RIFCSPLOWO2_01_FULL_59_34]|nr:MAG: hypothetical protein A2952_02750 [Candidatus Kaiserbacteria bacterium RIFCSPLOWO2_01_FULL_59_34]
MADAEEEKGSSKSLAGMFSVAWGLARIFLGGLLSMLLAGAVAGIVFAIVGYLFGSYILAGLTTLIAAAGSQAITWTGAIFNFFVEHLITRFSATLETLGIMSGIDVVWAAFRDVANIALIGLFVFLAINIILGVKEFGEKKMIAKVLVIATLLNFSLLFTKVIIDAANFSAYQFYKSAGLERGPDGATRHGGVSDAFLAAAGITTIGDTFTAVKALADKDTGAALAFSVVVAVLLFVMVALFLYASFQMISRAILLVFLMILSPLAFVSWLVPNSAIEANWKKWWESLLSAAFFAPLFMIALWASMLLLRKAAEARGTTTLGGFFTDPTRSAEAWTLIVVYCFAVGLLYASIKFASSFSKSIAGFSIVGQGLKNAMIGAPALAWRFGVAPLARQTIGRAAYYGREKLVKEGKSISMKAGRIERLADLKFQKGILTETARAAEYKRADEVAKGAGRYALAAGRADILAKAGFNIGDAGVARQLAKATGISEIIAGQRPKEVDVGFRQGVESKIKLGKERMEPLELTQGERRQMEKAAFDAIFKNKENIAEQGRLRTAHDSAERERDDVARKIDGPKSAAQKKMNDMEEQVRKAMLALSTAAEHEKETKRADLARWQGELKRAEESLSEINKPLEEVGARLTAAANAHETFTNKLVGQAEKERDEMIRSRQLGNVGAGKYVGERSAGMLYRHTGWPGKNKDKVGTIIGEKVASAMRGKVNRGDVRRALQRLRAEFGDDFSAVADET